MRSGHKQAGVRNRPQGQRATEGEGRAEGPLGVYRELLVLGPGGNSGCLVCNSLSSLRRGRRAGEGRHVLSHSLLQEHKL